MALNTDLAQQSQFQFEMQSITTLILAVATLTVGIVNCRDHKLYAPIVVSGSEIRLSTEDYDTIVHNQFMRIVNDDMTIGLLCAPSYYTINEHSMLVYCKLSH